MENRFDKDMQEKIRKPEMAEAGANSGALDDEALSQAAGGLRIGYDYCHYCHRRGIPLKWRSEWEKGSRPPGYAADELVCEDCMRTLR